MHQRGKSDGGDLTRDLGDPQRSADLIGGLAAGEDAADIGERAIHHEPGFLDAKPKRGGRVDTFGGGVARGGCPGDSEYAQPMGNVLE